MRLYDIKWVIWELPGVSRQRILVFVAKLKAADLFWHGCRLRCRWLDLGHHRLQAYGALCHKWDQWALDARMTQHYSRNDVDFTVGYFVPVGWSHVYLRDAGMPFLSTNCGRASLSKLRTQLIMHAACDTLKTKLISYAVYRTSGLAFFFSASL